MSLHDIWSAFVAKVESAWNFPLPLQWKIEIGDISWWIAVIIGTVLSIIVVGAAMQRAVRAVRYVAVRMKALLVRTTAKGR